MATVVPYVGTWIEIFLLTTIYYHKSVVPYVGTWIEIRGNMHAWQVKLSFPTWERG